jgi:membrane-associated protease RseP (regulator of RpoE activity)
MITLIISLIAINLLIIAHELGHFLLAKFYQVKIDEFSIGFPPKLFQIKRGEVIYSINAIPFGAFVKLSEDLPPDDKRNFLNKPALQKAIILLGGVLMNIFIAFIIFGLMFNLGFPKALLPSNYPYQVLTSASLLKYSLPQAIVQTGRFMYYVLIQSLVGLKIAFTKIFLHLDVNDLVGPVGLFALTSQGFKHGLGYGFYIVGLISYALAIFNLLPIPIVDGGRLLFLFLGKIFKKPISQKTENLIDNITFALLMFLAILVTIKDIRFFYFH